ncbi:hypothetical protein [Thiohalorhabdus methylotrophus]|uniref:Terminase small subunit n=1 Tax=Thiohalorhabdus methylotrophus TaxID=3242694 RepID=A0ABV4TV46_9GAMM
MSVHAPGAMRAAEVILNGRREITTSEGAKTPGELADYIEAETRIVELIDASRRLLQCLDDNPDALQDEKASASGPTPEQRVEQLRAALRAVIGSEEGSGAGGGKH